MIKKISIEEALKLYPNQERRFLESWHGDRVTGEITHYIGDVAVIEEVENERQGN